MSNLNNAINQHVDEILTSQRNELEEIVAACLKSYKQELSDVLEDRIKLVISKSLGNCLWCSKTFYKSRSDQKFCCRSHKTQYNRKYGNSNDIDALKKSLEQIQDQIKIAENNLEQNQ